MIEVMGRVTEILFTVLTVYFLRDAESRYVPNLALTTSDGAIDISRFQEATAVLNKINTCVENAKTEIASLGNVPAIIKKQRKIPEIDNTYNEAVEKVTRNLEGGSQKLERVLKSLSNRVRSHVKATVSLAKIIGDEPRPQMLNLIERAEQAENEPIRILQSNPRALISNALKKNFRASDYPSNIYGKKTSSYKKLHVIEKALKESFGQEQAQLQELVKQLCQGLYASKNIQKELKSTGSYSENIAAEEDAMMIAYGIATQVLDKNGGVKKPEGKLKENSTQLKPENNSVPAVPERLKDENKKEAGKQPEKPVPEVLEKAKKESKDEVAKQPETSNLIQPKKPEEAEKESKDQATKELKEPVTPEPETNVLPVLENSASAPEPVTKEQKPNVGPESLKERNKEEAGKQPGKSATEVPEKAKKGSVEEVAKQPETSTLPEVAGKQSKDEAAKEPKKPVTPEPEMKISPVPEDSSSSAPKTVPKEQRPNVGPERLTKENKKEAEKQPEKPAPEVPQEAKKEIKDEVAKEPETSNLSEPKKPEEAKKESMDQAAKKAEEPVKSEPETNVLPVPENTSSFASKPVPKEQKPSVGLETLNVPDNSNGETIEPEVKTAKRSMIEDDISAKQQETSPSMPEDVTSLQTPTKNGMTPDQVDNQNATPKIEGNKALNTDAIEDSSQSPANKVASIVEGSRAEKPSAKAPENEVRANGGSSKDDNAAKDQASLAEESPSVTRNIPDTLTAGSTPESDDKSQKPRKPEVQTNDKTSETDAKKATILPSNQEGSVNSEARNNFEKPLEAVKKPEESLMVQPKADKPDNAKNFINKDNNNVDGVNNNEKNNGDGGNSGSNISGNWVSKNSANNDSGNDADNEEMQIGKKDVIPSELENAAPTKSSSNDKRESTDKHNQEQPEALKSLKAETNPKLGQFLKENGRPKSTPAVQSNASGSNDAGKKASAKAPSGGLTGRAAADALAKKARMRKVKVVIFRKGNRKFRSETPLDGLGKELKHLRKVFEIPENASAGKRPGPAITKRDLEAVTPDVNSGRSLKRAYQFPGAEDWEPEHLESTGYINIQEELPETDIGYRELNLETGLSPEKHSETKDVSQNQINQKFNARGTLSLREVDQNLNTRDTLSLRDLSEADQNLNARDTLSLRDLSRVQNLNARDTLSLRDLGGANQILNVRDTLSLRDLSEDNQNLNARDTLSLRDWSESDQNLNARDTLSLRDLSESDQNLNARDTLSLRDLSGGRQNLNTRDTLSLRDLSEGDQNLNARDTLSLRDLSESNQNLNARDTLSLRDLSEEDQNLNARDTLSLRDLSESDQNLDARDTLSLRDLSESDQNLNARDTLSLRDLSEGDQNLKARDTLSLRDLSEGEQNLNARDTLSLRDLSESNQNLNARDTLSLRDLSEGDQNLNARDTLSLRDLSEIDQNLNARDTLSLRDLSEEDQNLNARDTLSLRDMSGIQNLNVRDFLSLRDLSGGRQNLNTRDTLSLRDLSGTEQNLNARDTLSLRGLSGVQNLNTRDTLSLRDLNEVQNLIARDTLSLRDLKGANQILNTKDNLSPRNLEDIDQNLNARDNFSLQSLNDANKNLSARETLPSRDYSNLGYILGGPLRNMQRDFQDVVKYAPNNLYPGGLPFNHQTSINPATRQPQGYPRQYGFDQSLLGQSQPRDLMDLPNSGPQGNNPLSNGVQGSSPLNHGLQEVNTGSQTTTTPNLSNSNLSTGLKNQQGLSPVNGLDKPGIVTAGIDAASNVAKATVHTVGAVGDAGLELVGGALTSAEGGVSAMRNFLNF